MAQEGKRVIVVEDHRELRGAMCALLESWGHTVRNAAEGERAIRLATSWHPDVMCIDLMLPGMNGFEVARRVIEALGDRRPLLVAVTGLSRDIDRRQASDAGFDAFISKPESVDLLQEVICGGFPLPAGAALAAPRRRGE